MNKKKKSEPTKIDYTLEQFLAESKRNETIYRVLKRMLKLIEKLDKRLEKLENE